MPDDLDTRSRTAASSSINLGENDFMNGIWFCGGQNINISAYLELVAPEKVLHKYFILDRGNFISM